MFENIPLVENPDSFPTIQNIQTRLLLGKYDKVPAMANKLFQTYLPKATYDLKVYRNIPTLSGIPDVFLQLAYYVCLSYIHLSHTEHAIAVLDHIEFTNSEEYEIIDPNVDDPATYESPVWKLFCICITNNVPDLLFVRAFAQFSGHKRLCYLLTLERLFSMALLTTHAYRTKSLIANIIARKGLLEDSYFYLREASAPDSMVFTQELELACLAKQIGIDPSYHYERALELLPTPHFRYYVYYLKGNISVEEMKHAVLKAIDDSDNAACTLLSCLCSMSIQKGTDSMSLVEKLTYKVIKANCFDISQMVYFKDLCWSLNTTVSKNFLNRLVSDPFTEDLMA